MFLDCSDRLAANPPRPGFGVCVTDIDGDGRFEFLVAGHGVANLALKWNGSALVDIADPVLADPLGRALGVAAADLDGDGREEIYIINSDKHGNRGRQADRLLAPFGRQWLDLFAQSEYAEIANLAAARSVACVDRTGRGRYGFIVANRSAPFALFELDRIGRLRNAAEEAGLDAIAEGRSLLPLPLLSERMDIFALTEGGPNLLFRNIGDGLYEEAAERLGLAGADLAGRGVAAIDTEGSGRFDLLCGNWSGPHVLFHHAASGRFEDETPEEIAAPSRVRTVIVADFDNDGYDELFFNNFGQPNRMFGWRHDKWVPIDIGDAALPHSFGTGAAAADIDGDGHLELLISHGEAVAQPLAFFKTPPNDYGWLRVLPLTAAGAPARGAVVTVTAGGRTQARLICSGSGYMCQMEPVAHFGLGEVSRVDRVEVRWPGGIAAIIDHPPIRRLLTVPYPPE